jgi:Tol biopolymer transport system component
MRRRWSLSAIASTLSVATAFTMIVLASGFVVGPSANAAVPGQNGRIAYVALGHHRAISTVNAAGGDPQPLIDLGSGRDAINPSWSWEGTKIAFAGQTSPGGPFAIYTANADGSGQPQQVTMPTVSDTDPTWSPFGGEIAFVRARSDGSKRIFIVDLATSSVRPLGASFGTDLEPAWSPEGSTIAFASKAFPTPPCPQTDCRSAVLIARADGSGLASGLRDPYLGTPNEDYHHPDWSPDGSKLLVTFGLDEFAFGPFGVRLFDASSGLPLNRLGPCWTMTEPSFSPDGQSIVLTSRQPTDPLTGELSEPSLCAVTIDGQFVFQGTPAGSDAAWGPVPGSTPEPQRDLSVPTMTFAFEPQPEPGGWFPFAPQVDVTATDNIGVASIRCTYDGQSVITTAPVLADDGLRLHFDLLGLIGRGEHTIRCSAEDLAGNIGTDSSLILIGEPRPPPPPPPPPPPDTTPPTVSPPSFSANPILVGGNSTVTAFAWDDGSGIDSGTVSVGDQPSEPMACSGSAFTAHVGPGLPAGLYPVSVRVRDAAGNEATTDPQTLVVYDPNAGSVSGTGWIVPDPSVGDDLPGIDGTAKGSFSFNARYKGLSDTTPTGSFIFTYGKLFKLQSEGLDWLVVTTGDTAYIEGTASIRGGGVYPFRVTIRDGAADGSPDYLLLEVCACSTFIETGPIFYRASGEVGGQIQIQR